MNYRTRIYEKYASCFQGTAPEFDSVAASKWGKAYDYYLRGWMPENKNAAIVDLACGGGNLLFFFKRRGYTQLCGVDISSEQISLSKQVVHDVTKGDVLEFLASHPDTFDLITGLDIIEHFYKDEALKFLELCHRSLRNSGRLIIQTPNADSLWVDTVFYGDFTHEVCFNPNSITRLLHLFNFQDVKVRELGPVPLRYSWLSSIRYIIWQMIRLGLKVWNIAETGGIGSGVFTRVFLISAIKE